MARHGLERVAVIDFDVHHGNGTQEIFWSKRDLFSTARRTRCRCSRAPGRCARPGWATSGTRRSRPATGTARFPRGAGEPDLSRPHRPPRPELILISAGFDAHRQRPAGRARADGSRFRLGDAQAHGHCRTGWASAGGWCPCSKAAMTFTGLYAFGRRPCAGAAARHRRRQRGRSGRGVAMINETPVGDLDFETALRELEEIVNRLESGGSTSRPRSPSMNAARR